MINYYPWSQPVFDECIKAHKHNTLFTLDLELSAICTKANCIYCDSKPQVGEKDPNELSWEDLYSLIDESIKLGLKWVYTCGLGEPLEDDRFWNLAELLHKNDVGLSLFTNGILIDAGVAKRLYDLNVNLILKLDTFDAASFNRILGTLDKAELIYDAAKNLLNAGYDKLIDGKYTRLAFSIVPNRLSYSGIEQVIDYCLCNNIFPSIGELEQAGRVIHDKRYDLGLDKDEVLRLKKLADTKIENNYCRPICPTIITGVHIDNIGNCVVDKDTGLNCKWFLLKDPKVRNLGNIKIDRLDMLFQKILDYRRNCFTINKSEIEKCRNTSYVFGGCGGNPSSVIAITESCL
jgi:MoaA/NifB/PqqE/SkfB family radical SAM enzyme